MAFVENPNDRVEVETNRLLDDLRRAVRRRLEHVAKSDPDSFENAREDLAVKLRSALLVVTADSLPRVGEVVVSRELCEQFTPAFLGTLRGTELYILDILCIEGEVTCERLQDDVFERAQSRGGRGLTNGTFKTSLSSLKSKLEKEGRTIRNNGRQGALRCYSLKCLRS